MGRLLDRLVVDCAWCVHFGALALLGLVSSVPRSAEATAFTWTQLSAGNASGSWATAANWNAGAGPIASGADNTADFSTLDITANSTVTLNGNQTIGHLVFGDTNTGTAANWIISAGTPSNSTLTLAVSSGSPTITVNTLTTTINSVIAGSAGLTKQGTGTLILTNTNTYSGGTMISDGVLRVAPVSSSSPLGSGTISNNASLVFAPTSSMTISNTIMGSGSVTQTGRVTTLLGNNSYSGTTTINTGAFLQVVADGAGLPNNSFLNLDGGVLMTNGTTSFTRSLGTSGAGKLQWNSNGGGFYSSNGTLTVNIGGTGAELVWGTAVGSQIVGPLTLSSSDPVATKTLFVNAIDLNNTATPATRTIVVNDDGGNEISGAIRNSNAASGLTISSGGAERHSRIALSGANSYTGTTTLSRITSIPLFQAVDGVGLPTASFLSLDGGIFESQGTTSFTRSLGASGSGKFQWTANGGGFSARGGQLTVNIGGAGGELVWGTTVGSQIVGPLMLGSADVSSKTLFVNGIDLNNTATPASRDLQFTGPVYTTGFVEISGVIRNSNAAGGLTINGILFGTFGSIYLSGANTYSGTTTLNSFAVLRANDGVGLPTASFLSLNDGKFEGNGTTSFTRSLGTSGAGKFQLTGNGGGFAAHDGQLTVNIGGAGAEVVWGTTVGSQIVGPVTFGALTANAKTLFVNGIDLNNTATAATRTIRVAGGTGGDSAEISGVIRNSNATGNLSITSDIGSSGTLILSGENTYSGTTSVGPIRVQIGNGGVTGSLGSGPVVISNSFESRLIFNRSNTLTVGNTISGGSSFGDTLTQAGTGTTIFTGNNSYSGTTTISAGVLQIGNGGTTGTLGTGAVTNNAGLVFNRSDSITVANGISGTGSVTQSGSGTTIFTGTNSYSGATNINAGVLQVGNGGSTGSLGTGTVTNDTSLVFNRTGSLTVTAAIGGSGSLTQAGTGAIILTGANSWGGTTTISAGTLQIGSGGTSGTLGTGAVTNNANLTFNRSDSVTVGNVISGTGSVTKNGNGTTILTAANTYGGTTTINLGAVQIGNGGTTGTVGSGPVTMNGSLRFNRSDSIIVGNAISGSGVLAQIGTGTTILTGTNSYTGTTQISAGTLQIGNGGTTGTLGNITVSNSASLVFNRSNSLTVGNLITSTGTVTQAGSGTTILTSNNTYSGATTISEGVLQVGNGGSTGSLGTGAVTNNASLVFNRSNAITVSNSIGGTGSLTQAGTGPTVLTGTNSYDTTFINAGTLQIGSGTTGTLGTGAVTNNANLVFTRSDSMTVGNAISGTGSVGKGGGAGTIILTGANSYSGTTTISAGQLQIGNGGTTGTLGTGAVTNSASLVFNRSNSMTVGNSISGSGSVTKTGSGTLILTASNTYAAGTTINAGTLSANNTTDSATGSGAIVVNGGGTLAGAGAVSGAVTINSGGTLAPGASVESLAVGALTFNTGATFHVELDSDASLTAAADLVNANGNLGIFAGAILALADLGNTILADGTKFTLISYAGTWNGGIFLDKPDDSLVTVGANIFRINYNDTSLGANFGGGAYAKNVTLTAVPEASSFIFGGIVCVALAGIHFRRKLLRRRAAGKVC